jgi:hypothetical protein
MRLPLVLLLLASAAWAHDLDVVYLQLTDGADGGFVERMTMAAGTLGQLAPVDADGDGELTEADLAQRQEAVRSGVWEQMPLSAGEKPCVRGAPSIAIRDTYLELWASWACGPGELKQELKWLRILPSNYRVVLGSQLDGERGASVASGNVQTLYIPRPGAAKPAPPVWPFGVGLALSGLALLVASAGRKRSLSLVLRGSGLLALAAGGWLLGGF